MEGRGLSESQRSSRGSPSQEMSLQQRLGGVGGNVT